jgi:hypothetical protein
MKRNKTLSPKKPYAMTARCPENRQGTRSFRAYNHYCWGNNTPLSTHTLSNATARQWAKADKLMRAGASPKNVQGRVIRCLLQERVNQYGEYCDAQFYGHP